LNTTLRSRKREFWRDNDVRPRPGQAIGAPAPTRREGAHFEASRAGDRRSHLLAAVGRISTLPLKLVGQTCRFAAGALRIKRWSNKAARQRRPTGGQCRDALAAVAFVKKTFSFSGNGAFCW
jgi:hypothetical protein